MVFPLSDDELRSNGAVGSWGDPGAAARVQNGRL